MPHTSTRLLHEAETFIRTAYTEWGRTDEIGSRLREIASDIGLLGRYEHTREEAEYGARLAWRNSNRCIGRLFWRSLRLLDFRQLSREEDIYEALLQHIDFATNKGNILPTLSLFAADTEGSEHRVRLWNHQLIRYAGYVTENGVIGDPASIRLTRAAEQLGWRGAGTAFDVLPLIVQIGTRKPRWFPIPQELVLEVPLHHPELDWFASLGLRWYTVPMIADMRLEIGGIHYPCAPFNGWYMGTEIGARNLADADRYNMLPIVAARMGLDTSTNVSLWKDRALLELNASVLHSFKSAGVSIVDHHTASEQLMRFEQQERQAGRAVTGDWTWLIPPVSPATTPVWGHAYANEIVKPNFFAPTDSPY
ncbi:nitric oxide synthase oxygenase [Paenibacillus koleovorans]|uniref:nitric oxide synthase oxygenase n=1 Tax=Paenibacillus koleovorans TaxID=121608 RepID=UPI000FDA663A|nr:nitric oxide synthase oxygenase [Paenibacillus koleovorans]